MHTHSRRSTSGFTLLEVLLVALIIGIAALAIVLTIPDRQLAASPQEAARSFQLKLNHAREQAMLRNWVVGVRFNETEYRFYRWHENDWALIDRKPLGPELLDEGLEIEFQAGDFRLLDNMEASQDTLFSEQEREREDRIEPQLIIFESTEFIPFRLIFRTQHGGQESWIIDGRNGLDIALEEADSWL